MLRTKGKQVDRIRRLENQLRSLSEQNKVLSTACDSYERIIKEKDLMLSEIQKTFDQQKSVLDEAIQEANEQKAAYEKAVREANLLKKDYEKRFHRFIKKMKLQGDEFEGE